MGDVINFKPATGANTPFAVKIPDLLMLKSNHLPVMVISAERILTIYGTDGRILVEINLNTGHVTAKEEHDIPVAAHQFWTALAYFSPFPKKQ